MYCDKVLLSFMFNIILILILYFYFICSNAHVDQDRAKYA